MTPYDIFICYRGGSAQSCELGTRIYNTCRSNGRYRIFFAPECIGKGENFKTIVPEVMKDVTVVLLLLDHDFFKACRDNDDIVDFELRTAFSNPNILFLPIFINHFDFKDVDLSDLFTTEEIERIKHINGIAYTGIYQFSVERDLLQIIDKLYDGGERVSQLSQRSKQRYYDSVNEDEADFLKLQQQMLYDYDTEVYEKLLSGGEDLAVLDVGCNTGLQTMKRFGHDHRVKTILGIDRDASAIAMATDTYPAATFACIDAEGASFREDLKTLLARAGVEKLDLITISMVILHLEKPQRLLSILKSFLSPGGRLFIRDIDDGLNLCYPNPNGIFDRLTSICGYCDMLGFRNSGRQIYAYLKDAEYTEITLEKSGFNTCGMSYEEKEALFDIYFGYIPKALKKTIERNPDFLRAQHDLVWVNEVLDTAYEEFMKSNFIFSLGYMIYTAKK